VPGKFFTSAAFLLWLRNISAGLFYLFECLDHSDIKLLGIMVCIQPVKGGV